MNKHSFLALVLLGVISLGCAKEIPEQVGNDDLVIPGSTGDPVTVTTTITLADASGTKALTAAGVKTFAPGDEVAVIYMSQVSESQWWTAYYPDVAKATLSAEDISNDGKSARISVSMNQIIPDAQVRIIYPAKMLNPSGYRYNEIDDDSNINYAALATQDGTLASLAANLDLAVYDGRCNGVELPRRIQMENRLAICEFTVRDDDSNDITSSVTRFSVSDGTDTYTVSRAAGPGPIYVAMKPVSNGNLTFSATDASSVYEKSVTAKTLEANKMYPIGVTMAKSFDARATPLTFEAINACTVTYSPADPSLTVQYRLNGANWTDYSAAIDLAAGDILAFRGKNDTYKAPNHRSIITCSDDCYLYGNIMSLVTDYTQDPYAFVDNVELVGESTFYRLFNDSNYGSHIKSHASKPVVLPATTLTTYCYGSLFEGTGLTTAPALPATTLASYCYGYMFSGCTGLTTAPVLPATTLASFCYSDMFSGCTGLTTAPVLPATTLASYCYGYMFSGCTGLTTAPVLPATTLASYCYSYMFSDCTGLTVAPTLPASTLAINCYRNMFSGCTGLTTAPDLPATALASYCYSNMFSDCTGLTTAPDLPATTLASCCYQGMFYGCTNLNSLTCYALSLPQTNCISNWLGNTSESGTLRVHPAIDPDSDVFWIYNNTNIPNGWTVEKYVVATKALAMASWEDVGRVIGADGNVYSTIALAESAGTTAEAMIAYMGAVDDVCEHGLAVSLTDVSDSENWNGAAGAISTWASSHTVPGCSWRLPSFKDWQYLLFGMFINNLRYDSSVNVLLSCVGETVMDAGYWSSTSLDENTARIIIVLIDGDCYLDNTGSKDDGCAVRACLSF